MTQIILAFKETTWSYSKFVYLSTFLCKPVPPRSQPIQICCTMITNMQTELSLMHCLRFQVLLDVPTNFLSALIAGLSNFLQMFIVLGICNFAVSTSLFVLSQDAVEAFSSFLSFSNKACCCSQWLEGALNCSLMFTTLLKAYIERRLIVSIKFLLLRQMGLLGSQASSKNKSIKLLFRAVFFMFSLHF